MAKNKNRVVIMLVIALLLLSIYFIINSKTDPGLKIHYYKDGVEVFIGNSLSVINIDPSDYDEISFEIIGENTGQYLITNMKIEDASPIQFKEALPTLIKNLDVGDSKTLWISDRIPVDQLKILSQPVKFWVNISGESQYVQGKIYDYMELDLSFETEISLWDVSTAIYNQKYKLSPLYPTGLFFKQDGTRMYTIDYRTATRSVGQYSLSTPWDVSTASFINSKNINSEEIYPWNIFLKSDGTKMYILGTEKDGVSQYSLSTPWDVSTALYDNKFKYVGSEGTFLNGLFLKSDGTKMYITERSSNKIHQYSLSTPWDVSTALYDNKFRYFYEPKYKILNSVFFKQDGTSMYVIMNGEGTIYQYSLG